MLSRMRRQDATLNKKELDINWLTRQDPRVIKAAEKAPNPTQAKRDAFQSGLSARNARNALRLAIFKRDRADEYEKLMKEYRATTKGGAL